MGSKEQTSGDTLSGHSGTAIPRRQPDGDPPLPPVQIPGPSAPVGIETPDATDGIVTKDDLRDLLAAPEGAALVVEEGQARVVDAAAAGEALPILDHDALATMLHGPGADPSDETLAQLAAGLDTAVRQQGA